MSDVVSPERREIIRAALKQTQLKVTLTLEKLDTYDKRHLMEIERAAGGLIGFFPANSRNASYY